jgi:hypothetical protein
MVGLVRYSGPFLDSRCNSYLQFRCQYIWETADSGEQDQ